MYLTGQIGLKKGENTLQSQLVCHFDYRKLVIFCIFAVRTGNCHAQAEMFWAP